MTKPSVILITGGSCSGKSEFTKFFKNACILHLDSFYKHLKDIPKDSLGNLDFDRPDAIDLEEAATAIKELIQNKSTKIPLYDMKINDRSGFETISLEKNTKYVIVEGLFAFYPPLGNLGDMKIFLDTPGEIRVARRMIRDVKRKGLSKPEILLQFTVAEKNYQKFVEPMKEKADIVIPFSYNPLQFTS